MKKPREQIFVSIDIEADGPIPGPHSMLSLGAVAFKTDGEEIGSWYENFDLLPLAQAHPLTDQFWAENHTAYQLTRTDTRDPEEAMRSFASWLETLPGRPVAVAAPAGFDFTFVYWYLMRFVGHSPFSFSCIDVKSVVMTLLNKPYHKCGKSAWKREWISGLPHTHHALDDAREQGVSWCKIYQEIQSRDHNE
jgi:hypothetical protein